MSINPYPFPNEPTNGQVEINSDNHNPSFSNNEENIDQELKPSNRSFTEIPNLVENNGFLHQTIQEESFKHQKYTGFDIQQKTNERQYSSKQIELQPPSQQPSIQQNTQSQESMNKNEGYYDTKMKQLEAKLEQVLRDVSSSQNPTDSQEIPQPFKQLTDQKYNPQRNERNASDKHKKQINFLQDQVHSLMKERHKSDTHTSRLKQLIHNQSKTIEELTETSTHLQQKHNESLKDLEAIVTSNKPKELAHQLDIKYKEKVGQMYQECEQFKMIIKDKELKLKESGDKIHQLKEENEHLLNISIDWEKALEFCQSKLKIKGLEWNGLNSKTWLYPFITSIIERTAHLQQSNTKINELLQCRNEEINDLVRTSTIEKTELEDSVRGLNDKIRKLLVEADTFKLEKEKTKASNEMLRDEIKELNDRLKLVVCSKNAITTETMQEMNKQVQIMKETHGVERSELADRISRLTKEKIELQTELGRLGREKYVVDFELGRVHQSIDQSRDRFRRLLGL